MGCSKNGSGISRTRSIQCQPCYHASILAAQRQTLTASAYTQFALVDGQSLENKIILHRGANCPRGAQNLNLGWFRRMVGYNLGVRALRGPMNSEPGSASPYSTGGGGVVFEHTYAATALAALLLGDSIPGLGDEQSVVSVTFQARRFSAVDDLVVMGTPAATASLDERRQLSIAVRRKPSVVPSDRSFLDLLTTYLKLVTVEWPRIEDGRLRLGLVVSATNVSVRELTELAEIARSQPNDGEFRAFAAAPGTTRQAVRKRLGLLDQAVAASQGNERYVSDLTWRLLIALFPIEVGLESNSVDRTATVARLRAITGSGGDANHLFSELCRLAAKYAQAGATVNENMLRRDLMGRVSLGRSRNLSRAWEILKTLEHRVRQRTGRELMGRDGHRLTIDRQAERDNLAARTIDAAKSGRPLVVTGQPDVGKSTLALACADILASKGNEVVVVNLRDLPASVAEAEALLGASLTDVIGSIGVSPVRVLLVDGAEAALEGHFDMLSAISEASRLADVITVAVTRSDARAQVVEAVTSLNSNSIAAAEVDVGGLGHDDITRVVDAFPALKRVAEEPRSTWLLERPGLISLLLKSDALTALPDGAVSEADIFAAVWRLWVRRSELNEPGRGAPDAREHSLRELARQQLLPDSPTVPSGDPHALTSLRSDGLLLSPGPWSPGDHFATDLIRDLSLAHLFLRDGWSSLTTAGAPRWALRAARLACQARFAQSPEGTEAVRVELQDLFNSIAAEHGDRWADLPLEALLTLGSPNAAFERAWRGLLDAEGAGIKRLLRLTLQRYSDGLSADPIIAEPVVELLVDHEGDLASSKRELRESKGELEIRWLRGLALRGPSDEPNRLRQVVRDRLLDGDIPRHSEWVQECVAILGPDLSLQSEAHLRNLAAESPGFLAACVEAPAVGLSMACHRPELLLDLAETYYIDTSDRWEYGYAPYDDGVRHHHRKGGFGQPLSAWYYGPFWGLLRARPLPALAFINRLLDHGVRARIRLLRGLRDPTERDIDDRRALPALTISLPMLGEQEYVGDPDSWSWYRGSAVGPYPCISALQAVERFVDQCARSVSLKALVFRLLDGCRNLAMPGLVVGFLVRHLDAVTDELDRWLADPTVWELEFGRATREGHFHVQGPDPEDLVGRDRRSLTLREVATQLTLRAIVKQDVAAIKRLREVSDALLDRAAKLYGTDLTQPGSKEGMERIQAWASLLRAESYEAVRVNDERVGLLYTPPLPSDEFRVRQEDLSRGMEAIRLLNYAHEPARAPAHIATLARDLELAIELAEHPPELGEYFVRDALPAVAATAVIAHAEARFGPDRKQLEWAVAILVQASMGTADSAEWDGSFFSMGGDRSAALALPCLMLPTFEEGDSWLDREDRQAIHGALSRLILSGSDEVRRTTARGLTRVWSAPCSLANNGNQPCRHEIAFELVEASLRDCRMGRFDKKAQRRRPIQIEKPSRVLDRVAPEDMIVGRLVPAMIASSACVMAHCCVSGKAKILRDALFRAHAKGAVHWVAKNFQLDMNPEVQRMVAECVLTSAVAGDIDAFRVYSTELTNESTAFYQFLHEVARVATYDMDQRSTLCKVWPEVMAHLLEVICNESPFLGKSGRGQRERDEAIASLIMRPQIRVEDAAPEATLQSAKEAWLDLDSIDTLITRWLPLAKGIPQCVDSIVGFLDTTAMTTQVSRGLDLVLIVVDGQFESVASHTWLLFDWLERLKASRSLNTVALAKVHVLADGLAAHGDWRAVRLQKSLE